MHFPTPKDPVALLVDNGSLQAASTLSLRRIAADLTARVGRTFEPVSLLHSSAVPTSALAGRAAEILEPAIRRRWAGGARSFLIVPLFFGPSGALTDYLPRRVAVLRRDLPELAVALAPPLVDPEDPSDGRMARILADHVRETCGARSLSAPAVVLVDHGSPQRKVVRVRDHVAAQLRAELGGEARKVIAASMERREGIDYTFAEPLLERALADLADEFGGGLAGFDVVAAMLFISPGRHAGEGGDVEQICRAAEQEHRGLRVHLTRLVGEHPLLLDVLKDRIQQAAPLQAGTTQSTL